MTQAQEEHVRTVLLLELNCAFANASRHCMGDKEEQELLQALIEEVKLCVNGGHRSSATQNTAS
jgi:hypothetical protein